MTEWFNRSPGGASVSVDDPSMLLLGDETPDWVRAPAEIGDRKLKVLGSFYAPCPMCTNMDAAYENTSVLHLKLEDSYGVAECLFHGFVWYRQNDKKG